MLTRLVISVIFALLFNAISGITITRPVAGDVIDITKPYTIRWNHTSADPSQISIDIVNKTTVPGLPTLDNLAHYIEMKAGAVAIQWPASLSNKTESYQLIFIDTPTGATFGYSGTFNLTIPPGETRSATLGTTGAVGPHAPPAAGLSGGAIAGTVIGILIAVTGLLACLYIFLRLRHKRKLQAVEDQEKKVELDGVAAERSHKDVGRALDEKGTDTTELDAKKDFLKFELPSTPARSPAEMEVPEIPAAEMPAERPGSGYLSATKPTSPLSETSETTNSTLVQAQSDKLHSITRKPVPTSQTIEESRPSTSVADAVIQIGNASTWGRSGPPRASIPEVKEEIIHQRSKRADTASLTSLRSPRNDQTPFAAALHDLISQELRRPED